MPPPEHMTVLLVSDQAEAIKRVTICLRSFYPGCRVEAVYSEEEALEWASKEPWHALLVDEHLPPRMTLDSLAELRRRAPAAAIIVLTESAEPSAAMQLVRGGADCALFTKSPGFLGELMVMLREVLEKRDLRLQRDLTQSRYLRLLELLPDLVYELDPDGRFVFVSQNVVSVLGYSPDELIGLHYSSLLLPDDREAAAFRFNERRTGARATGNLPLRLVVKPTGQTPPRVATVEVSAKGLYDRRNHLVGTIGTAHPVRTERVAEITAQPGAAEPLATEEPPAAAEPVTGPPSRGERRRAPRFELPLEAKLTDGERTWQGSVTTIGLGGVAMAFDGTVPAQANQAIRLGLASAVAVLQLKGVIQRSGELDRRRVGPRVFPGTSLVVELKDLGLEERMVLGSLLEGIRDRSVSATLTALLHPAEEEDVVLEASAELIGPVPRVPLESFPPEADEQAHVEQRLATRVNFVMAAHIQPDHKPPTGQPIEGRTLNLSLNGACLRLQTDEELISRRITIEFSVPPATPGLQDSQGDVTAGCRVVGEVAWVLPDPVPLTMGSSMPASRVGVRFLHLQEPGEDRLRTIVTGLLTYPLRIHGADSSSRLISTFMACRSHRGQPLAVFYDRPRKPLPPGAPLVVIAPDYGETKRDYVFLAYALASNGFHVLRPDYTNHVGESHGDMMSSTLSDMERDLTALLSFAANSWPASPLVLIGSGLGGRVALKASAHDGRARLLILLSGVLDVRAALRAVHGEDVVGAHLAQARTGILNTFGLNVDAGRWLGDLVQQDFMDLASTVRDAQRITAPTILYAGEQDPRTPFAAVKEVAEALGSEATQTYLLPEPTHRLHEDPRTDRALYRQVIVDCLERCYPASAGEGPQPPSLREIDRQRLLELDRLLARRSQPVVGGFDLLAAASEPEPVAGGFGDGWRLLDDVYRLMGQIELPGRILDVACGTGHFGKVLLINQAYRSLHGPLGGTRMPLYVGVDADPKTLARAMADLQTVGARLSRMGEQPAPVGDGVPTAWGVLDPAEPFPFKDGVFERIVCNFALNTLVDPLSTVRELIRLLVPGGRLILASLKPHADFALLYRRIVANAQHEEARRTAERLLRHWGTIAEAEGNGTLRLFSRLELSNLLRSSGLSNPRVYPTLVNQAYLALAEKTD